MSSDAVSCPSSISSTDCFIVFPPSEFHFSSIAVTPKCSLRHYKRQFPKSPAASLPSVSVTALLTTNEHLLTRRHQCRSWCQGCRLHDANLFFFGRGGGERGGHKEWLFPDASGRFTNHLWKTNKKGSKKSSSVCVCVCVPGFRYLFRTASCTNTYLVNTSSLFGDLS